MYQKIAKLEKQIVILLCTNNIKMENNELKKSFVKSSTRYYFDGTTKLEYLFIDNTKYNII